MSPVGEQFGYGHFLSAYVEGGKTLQLQHGDEIDVKITGTPTGGHVRVVENQETVIDTDLNNGATVDFITSDGVHAVYAGDVDRQAVETAIAGVESHDLPNIIK